MTVLAQNNTAENDLNNQQVTEEVVSDKDTVLDNTLFDSKVVESAVGEDGEGVEEGVASVNANQQISPEQDIANNTPEVGKHVMANMNVGSMILSLLMVLALIILCAFVLKRFNLTQQGVSQLKVVTSLSLGTKERVMVVQVGEQQMLIGVTAQQITLLEKLSEPLAEQSTNAVELPKNLLSFLSAKKL